MQSEAVVQLKQGLRGRLIQRADSDYDEARKLYNGMIDKRPLMIARCVDVGDVVAAVNFGREHGLRVAVRGGGHNGPGLGSVDDGLVIDLSVMKGVRVDPASKTVRVEAGCTSGDVDHATHAYGLAVPFGIVSTTGVAGLTLGGGMGYLSRKHGLTIDNLIEADVVLASGEIVTASKSKNADLYWGLRGGGGNFGVVTSFLFQAHPVKTVYAGPVFWDFKHARTVMQKYREFLPGAPEELGAFVGLKTVSAGRSVSCRTSGQARLRDHLLLQRPGRRGREGDGQASQGVAGADVQLARRDAFSRDAGAVRSVPPQRAAMVLARRFREGADGRSDRRASRAGQANPQARSR